MTLISRTKIEYGDYIFNPVIGCLRKCPYCWARGFARRFAKIIANKEYRFKNNIVSMDGILLELAPLINQLKHFKPTFLEHNFAKEFPKKPSMILVGFMTDINYWEKEWMKRVLDKIKQYQQHKFVFLSKEPLVTFDYIFPYNCILGYTITDKLNRNIVRDFCRNRSNKTLLNIEPMHNKFVKIDLKLMKYFDWIVVGAETGNCLSKIIPKREWIESIVNQARQYNIPIFLKDNLKEIWGGKLIQEKIK